MVGLETQNMNVVKPQTVFLNLSPFSFFFLFWSFLSFRTAPTAYGGSQARGPIRTVAAGLCQNHSNAGSELHL